MTAGERQPLTADEFDRQVERSHDSTVSASSRARARVNLRDAYSDVLARAVTAVAALAAIVDFEIRDDRSGGWHFAEVRRIARAGSSPAADLHTDKTGPVEVRGDASEGGAAPVQANNGAPLASPGSSTAAEAELDAHDLRFDIFRSGAGQQAYPNVKASAVKITHIPTGLSSECSEHTSQLRNKEQALAELRAQVAASGVSDTREGECPDCGGYGCDECGGSGNRSPVPAVADDPSCVCAMTSIRNCPVHGQGDAVADDPEQEGGAA